MSYLSDAIGGQSSGQYPIGALIDFAGLPAYYNSGSLQWMQTGVSVPAGNLSTKIKTTLRAVGSANVVMSDNAALSYANGNFIYLNGLTPAARTASVCCFPWTTDGSTVAKSLTMDSTGIYSVSTGLLSAQVALSGEGGGTMTSDGTTIWSWSQNNAASGFLAANSTDGKLWTAATLTGQATFTWTSQTMGPSGNYSVAGRLGEVWANTAGNMSIAAYCGARHLLIGANGSGNYLAQRATNGLAWGGDETAAILGSASLAQGAYGWWNRNGNNFYITVGGAARASADGGVTWAASTNATTASVTSLHRTNASDAARIACATDASTTLKISTNSGSTWTSRTAPLTMASASTSLCGRAAVWGLCDGSSGLAYKSADDGATWSAIATPTGFVSTMQGLYADANRFYLVSAAGNQVATSTDLTTWTVRNISNPVPGTGYASTPENLVATDTSTIMGAGTGGVILYSPDGGVTWNWASPTSDTTNDARQAKYYQANIIGTAAFICGLLGHTTPNPRYGYNYVYASDVTAGGRLFRPTSAVIAPVRSGALTYARVA